MKQLTLRQLHFLKRSLEKKLKVVNGEIKTRYAQNVPYYSVNKNKKRL
jgi:hypothetical protein